MFLVNEKSINHYKLFFQQSVTVNEQTKNQLELFNKVLNILPLTIFGLTLTLASVASLILCIVLYLLYTNQSVCILSIKFLCSI